jgi:hypothetical protein
MLSPRIQKPRFIIGLLLVAIAVLMFLLGDYPVAGVAAVAVLGLISIATARP